VLQASERMDAIAYAQVGERALALAVTVAVISFADALTPAGAESIWVGAAVVAAASVLLPSVPTLYQAPRHHDGAVPARRVWGVVSAVLAINIAAYVVGWVDLLVLALLRDSGVVGVYSLAYQAYTFVIQLVALWIVAALPGAVKAAHQVDDFRPIDNAMLVVATRLWATGMAIVAAAGMLVLPLVGAGYGAARGPMALLFAGGVLIVVQHSVTTLMLAYGQQRDLARTLLCAAASNVVIGFALTPFVGIWGPAVATSVTAIAVGLVFLRSGVDRALQGFALKAAGPGMTACILLACLSGSDPAIIVVGLTALGAMLPAARRLLAARKRV